MILGFKYKRIEAFYNIIDATKRIRTVYIAIGGEMFCQKI